MDKVIINEKSQENFFLDYLNFLEGVKTHFKVIHWSVNNIDTIKDKRGAHIYVDDFLKIVSDYQDTIAEVSQGILGDYITIDKIQGKSVPTEISGNLKELCKWLQHNVIVFNSSLSVPTYVGIKSETETFIKDIQKYNYLFSFCI